LKTALITGITGQIGSYFAELLLSKNYKVIGLLRRNSTNTFDRIEHIKNQITLEYGDVTDEVSLQNVFKKYKIDECYHLAAQSFVGLSWEQPVYTSTTNAIGTLKLLEVIRTLSPETRLYNSSTSEMFGKVQEIPQTEKTPFYPRSPYGTAKLYSHFMTINYRESYNLFACSGICFNMESPRRGKEFVTKKIINAVKENKLLKLGNIYAKRDWSYAPDSIEAMYKMLQQDAPKDYVISSGETHSIKEFIIEAFAYKGKELNFYGEGKDEKACDNYGNVVMEIDEKFYRPAEVDLLIGDSSLARKELNWEPKVKFEELVKIMMESDF